MQGLFNEKYLIAIPTVVGLLGIIMMGIWKLGSLAEKNVDGARQAFLNLVNPVSFISLLILLGVFFLLGMAILDLDSGHILLGMGRVPFARGLITFLFAIVTIGTAVVLVLSALLGKNEQDEKSFNQGKEVLGLLLGVFGTIIGFYFASELNRAEAATELKLSPVLLSKAEVRAGESVELTLVAQGGTPPYRYAAVLGSQAPDTYAELARVDGWIKKNLVVPREATRGIQNITIAVQDMRGEKSSVQTSIVIQPAE